MRIQANYSQLTTKSEANIILPPTPFAHFNTLSRSFKYSCSCVIIISSVVVVSLDTESDVPFDI